MSAAHGISRQNALKLSAWIATQHPELFRRLVTQTQALQRSPLGRYGAFGDATDLTFVPDLPPIEIAYGVDYESTAAYTPDLAPVSSFDVNLGGDSALSADLLTGAITEAPATVDAAAPAASGSFWDSIGSGASSMTSAIGKVASALISPASIVAVGGAAAAYFGAQGKSAQAQTQNAVLQAQLARTSAGAAPAAISYVRNPATGAMMPVYNTPTGQVPVTGSMLSSLASPVLSGTVAGIPTSLLLIGGGLLVLTVILSGRNTVR